MASTCAKGMSSGLGNRCVSCQPSKYSDEIYMLVLALTAQLERWVKTMIQRQQVPTFRRACCSSDFSRARRLAISCTSISAALRSFRTERYLPVPETAVFGC
jgi:hypothetical protein